MIKFQSASESASDVHAGDRAQLHAHAEDLQSVTGKGGLADCLDGLREWLDVKEIVVAVGGVGTLVDSRIVAAGYDPKWIELYFHEAFFRVDPIVCAITSGRRFLNRAHAAAEYRMLAARGSNGPTLAKFLEAANDYGRLEYGFASGVVFNGNIALCSVLSGHGRSSQRAPMLLRALRPALFETLLRVLLPGPVFPPLSSREHAVLECLASGYEDPQIADALSISVSTVRFHMGNVFDKLGARNRCHAVAIGFQSGLLQR